MKKLILLIIPVFCLCVPACSLFELPDNIAFDEVEYYCSFEEELDSGWKFLTPHISLTDEVQVNDKPAGKNISKYK